MSKYINKLLEGEVKEFLNWFNIPSLLLGLVIGGIGLLLPKGKWTILEKASFELNIAEITGFILVFGPPAYLIYKAIRYGKSKVSNEK